MGASVFANLRRRSALKARASIIISRPRPRWPRRSRGDTETGFWRRSRRSRMSASKMPSPRTVGVSGGARSGRTDVPLRCLGGRSGALSPDVAGEVLSFFRRCIDDLSRRIGGPDAEARAFHVTATLEGGSMLARVYGHIEAFDQAAAGLFQPWHGVDHRETFETQGSAP
jgi:hypothetical protein